MGNVIETIIAMIILLHFVQQDIIGIIIIVVMDIIQNIGLVPVVVTRILAINVKPVVGMNVLLKSVCLSKGGNQVVMFMAKFMKMGPVVITAMNTHGLIVVKHQSVVVK